MNLGLLTTLVPGLTQGISRGIQLELDGSRIFAYAIKHNDQALLKDISAVLEKQIEEGLDVSGLVKGNIVAALLTGSDPFAGSRRMLQDLETSHKFGHDNRGALVLPK